LRVPWTARRSNQSILKEVSPGISLEGMMLKLKLQYFGHLMQRIDSLVKTVMLGGIGGRRRRGRQRMFVMTSAFSWQNSISLCPASFLIPRPNLPITSGVSSLPNFAFQSPIMKRTYFLGVSSKRLKLKLNIVIFKLIG